LTHVELSQDKGGGEKKRLRDAGVPELAEGEGVTGSREKRMGLTFTF